MPYVRMYMSNENTLLASLIELSADTSDDAVNATIEELQTEYAAASAIGKAEIVTAVLSVPLYKNRLAEILTPKRVNVRLHMATPKPVNGVQGPQYATLRIDIDGEYFDSCRLDNATGKFARYADSDLMQQLAESVRYALDNLPSAPAVAAPVNRLAAQTPQEAIEAAERALRNPRATRKVHLK